jgi:methylmalonyl-CoA/ethylmalonyl-CoA epimerase
MSTRPLDHVGVVVASIAASRPLFERMSGSPGSPVEELPHQGVNVAFFGQVELIEPRSADSGVARFLEKRGPGLHHVAWRVTDLAAELRRLEAEGYELVDREPRPGAGGHRVAFLHPRSTGGLLVELVEDASGVTPSG